VKPAPVAASDSAMRASAAIYRDSCAACHRENAGEDSVNDSFGVV
jgi:mono/diheme cytochrome c family protein